jgi:Ser/Thr protein kinase RdoA (MazF antagonist)
MGCKCNGVFQYDAGYDHPFGTDSGMTGEPKVHGLSGDWVKPDWPFLTDQEVSRLLRRFPDASGGARVLTRSPRPFSAAGVVATSQRKVFVKRHHESVRDREGLLEEHRFLQHLRCHGGRVPAVLADEDGETVIRAGEWTYEVHALAEGLDLYEQELSWTPFHSAQQAHAAGRAMAQLHLAAAGYDAPPRKAQTLVSSFSIFGANQPWPVLENYVAQRPALAEYLSKGDWRAQTEAALMPFHAGLQRWLASLQPLWTHNDLHASNLLWSSDAEDASAVSVIDFGLADRTNAVHDIATAIERNGVRWLDLEGNIDSVVHLEQVEELLHGYEEVRPLTDAEAHAVPAMLPLVHAEFALSETDYFLRILRSDEKASIAWEGYFLGHADWFRSDAGRRLLDRLESWADGRPSVVLSDAKEQVGNVTP